MLSMMKTRKKRSDRNHVIYCINNNITGEQYVGLTALSYKGNVKRTLTRRMQKHYQRAMAEDKGWSLCESLRTYGAEAFTFGMLEVVRGKAAAHERETALIKMYDPKLNTFK
jgi:group I intron endonuclease